MDTEEINEVELKDISDELLILNKITIEKLFSLENCDSCVALYMFYYKTAKWQKTNIIKSTDTYVSKVMKWGKNKITNIKKILKENGLINIVQRRSNGKILGWYIKVNYIISDNKLESTTIHINCQNPPEQEVAPARTGCGDTNAYNNNINAYNNNINAYNNTKENSKKKKDNDKKDNNELEELINEYTTNLEVIDSIHDFMNMRKKIKKPLVTKRALKTVLNRLDGFAKNNDSLKVILLDEATSRCWLTVYASNEVLKSINEQVNNSEKNNIFKNVEKIDRSKQIDC